MTYTGKVWSTITGKYLKGGLTPAGYLTVYLTMPIGKRKTHYIHRMVTDVYLKNTTKGLTVNHKNGVKTNNHIDNLEMMTYSENLRHAADVLKVHRSFTLAYKEVLEIRDLARQDIFTHKELGALYGISREHARDISSLKRRTRGV